MGFDATPILSDLRRVARRVAPSGMVDHDDLVQAAAERLWRTDRECNLNLALHIAELAMVDEIRKLRGRTGTARNTAGRPMSLDAPIDSDDETRSRMDTLRAVGADPLAYVLAKEALAEEAARQEALKREPKIAGRTRSQLAGQALSQREVEILDHARRGDSSEETAAALSISPHTVKAHRGHAQAKLGARSLIHAVSLMYDRDLWPTRAAEAA
jgi:RNA polymerase sigma factor (sigma-70 family)